MTYEIILKKSNVIKSMKFISRFDKDNSNTIDIDEFTSVYAVGDPIENVIMIKNYPNFVGNSTSPFIIDHRSNRNGRHVGYQRYFTISMILIIDS